MPTFLKETSRSSKVSRTEDAVFNEGVSLWLWWWWVAKRLEGFDWVALSIDWPVIFSVLLYGFDSCHPLLVDSSAVSSFYVVLCLDKFLVLRRFWHVFSMASVFGRDSLMSVGFHPLSMLSLMPFVNFNEASCFFLIPWLLGDVYHVLPLCTLSIQPWFRHFVGMPSPDEKRQEWASRWRNASKSLHHAWLWTTHSTPDQYNYWTDSRRNDTTQFNFELNG